VGAKLDLPKHSEDLGQTLAVWGVGEGFYLVLPVFGPSNPRDGIGRLVDGYFDPLNLWATNTEREYITYSRMGVTAVSVYTHLRDELDDVKKTSVDYYATIRSLYRQKRASEIRNGAEGKLPPIPDLGFDLDEKDQQPASAK